MCLYFINTHLLSLFLRRTTRKLSNIGADKLLTKLDALLGTNPYVKHLTPVTSVQRRPPQNAAKIGWKKDAALMKNYLYLIDENGEPFPKNPWRTQLLSTARGILTDAADRLGLHHSDWRSNGRDFREHFIASIEEAYPVLANCEAHWKAIQLAQDHYPTWVKSYDRQPIEKLAGCDQKRKLEDVDDMLDERLEGKRLKLELETSTTFNKIQVSFIFGCLVRTCTTNS